MIVLLGIPLSDSISSTNLLLKSKPPRFSRPGMMRAMSSSLEYRFMYNVTLETAARSAHTKAAAAKKNAHLQKWRHISKDY